MINKKILLSIGSGLTVLTGLIAFTTAPSFAQKKPAIEVVTHAGAGGGTDVNSRMMMLRSRRTLKQIWLLLIKEVVVELLL